MLPDALEPDESTVKLIATCGFGLEPLLRRELAALGYESRVVSPGFVAFEASASGICRANLWLRVADRVLVAIAHGPAADFDALFELCSNAEWEHWIDFDSALPVHAYSVRSQLTSVPAIQRTVKRGLVNRLLAVHQTAALPETGSPRHVRVAIVGDHAWLMIDTTGPSLHRRGYRERYHREDLKESLAAALVLLTRWAPPRPLLDPFCGTGTIVIEAAMIALNKAPGREREFAAEQWSQVDVALWDDARREADAAQRDDLSYRLVGFDTDLRRLKQAREDAERAGVEDSVHFESRAYDQWSSKRKSGWVVTQTPWITQGRTSFETIRSLPLTLRHLQTWSHAILSDAEDLESMFGREADKRRKLYNDRRRCVLYSFFGPDDRRQPAASTAEIETASELDASTDGPPPRVRPAKPAPAFGHLGKKANEQAELFARRLEKRAKHLRRWPTRQGITCFRLYERDIPEIPLIVDRYEQCLHITEYERPHDRDVATHANWLDLMVATAGKTLDVAPENVFFKSRRRQRGSTQHERIADQHHEIEVGEGGLKFLVNLSDYVDTGLFLDHRLTREMVRDAARGKRFLNLFAYTGSFTVYAADGGAVETTTVDLSANYLDWAQRNLRLNKLDGSQHHFVRADTLEFLQRLPRQPLYDLAVVDPPTFSNSKRTEQDWEVQNDHVDVLNSLLARMSSGGVIYFSNNFRRFKFAADQIQAASIHEISNQTVPPDFRNRRIHRCWRIVAK